MRHGLRRTAWLMVLCAVPVAMAHPRLNECVRHEARMVAEADHIDIFLSLVLTGTHAASARASMDADGDGRVEQKEARRWAARFALQANASPALRANGAAVALIPLFEPRVELQGASRVTLHLAYFAAAPDSAAPLEFEDRFLAEAPAIVRLLVSGQDGARLEALSPTDQPSAAGTPRRLRVQFSPPPTDDEKGEEPCTE